MSIYVLVEKLRKEFENYLMELENDYIDKYEDVYDFDLESDLCMECEEELSEEIDPKYENIDEVRDFFKNIPVYEQNLLKLDIMASLYEYVNFYLEDYYSFESAISFVYKELLNSNNPLDFIKLYDKYDGEIMYIYVSIAIYSNESKRSWYKKILGEEKIKDILKISPASILKYRFMFGLYFDDENLVSIGILKTIDEIVENLLKNYDVKKDNNFWDQLKKEIDDNTSFDDDYTSIILYLLSNVYEHIINKNQIDEAEKNMIKFLDNHSIGEILSKIFKEDDSISQLAYSIYLYNKDRITEKDLMILREKTKAKGKVKVIKKLNSFYYEEEDRFNYIKQIN